MPRRFWPRPTVSSKCILKYMKQDIAFGVIRNEHGKAEFAMQVVKDGKGMMFTPGRRSVFIA